MNSLLRRSFLPALAACLALSARLSGADTPAAAHPPAVAPAATPAPKVVPLTLPKALEGVVTQEEFESYIKFTQSVQKDPDIKALNDQMRAKSNELMELRKQLQAAQQKAIEANPDIKVIVDKIRKGKPKPAVAPLATGAKAPAAVVTPSPAKK